MSTDMIVLVVMLLLTAFYAGMCTAAWLDSLPAQTPSFLQLQARIDALEAAQRIFVAGLKAQETMSSPPLGPDDWDG